MWHVGDQMSFTDIAGAFTQPTLSLPVSSASETQVKPMGDKTFWGQIYTTTEK